MRAHVLYALLLVLRVILASKIPHASPELSRPNTRDRCKTAFCTHFGRAHPPQLTKFPVVSQTDVPGSWARVSTTILPSGTVGSGVLEPRFAAAYAATRGKNASRRKSQLGTLY